MKGNFVRLSFHISDYDTSGYYVVVNSTSSLMLCNSLVVEETDTLSSQHCSVLNHNTVMLNISNDQVVTSSVLLARY